MIVLRILGILLLAVLAVLALGVAILLLTPIRVELRASDDTPIRLRLGFGPIHITRRLGRRRGQAAAQRAKSKKQKKKKAEKSKKPREPGPPLIQVSRIPVGDTVELALGLMDDLAGTLDFERLFVTVILHTGDAGQTGTLLGQLSALVGSVYPFFASCFVLHDHRITLDADYDAEHTVWSVDLCVMTRLRRYPAVLWKRRKQLWSLWTTIRTTKEEKEQWRREHASTEE